jgi:tRNA threonylcarbamoyladenosine biosynthesis protein TsaE
VTSFSVLSDSPQRTAAIAAALAPHLRPGDVVLLTGGLATGKTSFVQALAPALGSADVVTSPTFALVHIYRGSQAPILHIDAYRLSGVHEFRDLGLDEYIEESVTLIEWGDVVADDFPCHLLIALECRNDSPAEHRSVSLSSSCESWQARLPVLRDALADAAVPVIGSTTQ